MGNGVKKLIKSSIEMADLPTWGKIHCAECERPLAYFTPGSINEDDGLELYCFTCAEAIDKDDQ